MPTGAFDDRYVLYFDFLGTKDAATTWSRDRLYDFVDLLRSVALSQARQDITGRRREDGGHGFSVQPEITTFSDHVLVSWPTAGDDLIAPLWTDIVLQDAIRVLTLVAERGLRIDLLVRGGLSVGQMFHDGSASLGAALVEAHEIESKIAKKPRVVVADGVIAKLAPTRPEDCPWLLCDRDGRWHLDYFTRMMRDAVPRREFIGDSVERLSAANLALMENDIDQLGRWKKAHLEKIDREIEILTELGAKRPAAKWKWFKEQFQLATSRIS
jgi:hypothetical protein